MNYLKSETIASSLVSQEAFDALWITRVGLFEVTGNTIKSKTESRAAVDTGLSDGTVIAVLVFGPKTGGLVFRQSEYSYLKLSLTATGWSLLSTWISKSTGQAYHTSRVSGNHAKKLTSADYGKLFQLAVLLKDAEIKIYIDGSLVKTFTETTNVDSTEHGLYTLGAGVVFKDFSFSPLESEVQKPMVPVSPSYSWPGGPMRCNPYNLGKPNKDVSDYWSDALNVAYEPDGTIPNDNGVYRVRGFAYYQGTFSTAPLFEAIRNGIPVPDPAAKNAQHILVNGGLLAGLTVVKSVRAVGAADNDAIALWSNGLITTLNTQTGHGGSNFPAVKVPEGYTAADIALTSGNEMLLVALNNSQGRGFVWIVILEGRYLPHHTFSRGGLYNQGSFSAFKPVGMIESPVTNLSAISAASNGFWNGPSSTSVTEAGKTRGLSLGEIDKNLAKYRANLYTGSWKGVIARNGYCVVASRQQDTISVLDLTPYFTYIREAWLSSASSLTKTIENVGSERFQFPAHLDTLEGAFIPSAWNSFVIESPTDVLCGHSVGRWSTDFYKFFVTSADGFLHIFDASGIMATNPWEVKSSKISLKSEVYVGDNPVAMCFTRRNEGRYSAIMPDSNQSSEGKNSALYIVCRGDKSVKCVLTYREKAIVLRTLEDPRMIDPIDVCVCQRGYVVMVADHAGKQIVGWRIGNITDSRQNPLVTYPPLGNGLEISGFLPLAGKPVTLTSTNVN